MELGFSGEAFGNLLVLSCLVMVILMATVYIVAKKRGVDVTSTRWQLKVGTIFIIIFIIIPGLFSDLSIKDKIIASILALLVGFANFFAVDRMQKYLKDKLNK